VWHAGLTRRWVGGFISQTVQENTLIEHRLMLPPGNHGRVTFLAAEGQYTIAVRPAQIPADARWVTAARAVPQTACPPGCSDVEVCSTQLPTQYRPALPYRAIPSRRERCPPLSTTARPPPTHTHADALVAQQRSTPTPSPARVARAGHSDRDRVPGREEGVHHDAELAGAATSPGGEEAHGQLPPADGSTVRASPPHRCATYDPVRASPVNRHTPRRQPAPAPRAKETPRDET
jgi:hypothetical protein